MLLESMQDGILYSNILLKLYLKSLKNGGKLQLDENIPYTAQMIATITRQQVGTVERALQIFMKLGLVEPLQNSALYMSNIELLIGQSSTEGERKRRARLALQEQKALPKAGADKCPPYQADICPPEIEIEKEIEKDKEIENRERVRDNGSPTVDAGLAEIIRSFEDNLGGFPPAAREDLLGWREIFTDDLILLAIKKAALAGVRKWSYVNGILKVWKNEGVRTLGDVQSRDERRKPPAKDDYDAIFGGLV